MSLLASDRERRLWAWTLAVVLAICATPTSAATQSLVSFPTSDGGLIYADEYGEGSHAIILAHGGQFTKESWTEQARALAAVGFRALALDFRGRGNSRGGPEAQPGDEAEHLDVLAAIRYAWATGADRVSLVGASFGGWAAAKAATQLPPGEIDRVVLLAHSPIENPEELQGRKLFILTRGDFSGSGTLRLPTVRDQYERAPDPKELVVLEGSAHAQHVFETDQGARLMEEILRFLKEP